VQLTRDTFYGVHSVALLDRANGFLPFKDGIFEIVGGVNIGLSKEKVNLNGGSNAYPWESQDGVSSSEISMTLRQMNSSLLETAMGAVVNRISASAGGTISTLVNTKGNLVAAATKIASVAIIPSTGEANLKNGIYLVKAISATTVNIYATTNQDFLRGTDVEFQDDEMKLLASDITITTGGTTAVASLGIQLVGGTGTIALNTGDVAMFKVSTPHQGVREYSIGTVGSINPDIGMLFTTQKKSDGTVSTILLPKVSLAGFPLNFTEKAFFETEVSGTVLVGVNPFNTAEEGVAFITNKIGS